MNAPHLASVMQPVSFVSNSYSTIKLLCVVSLYDRLVTLPINRKEDTILDKIVLKSGPYDGYLSAYIMMLNSLFCS